MDKPDLTELAEIDIKSLEDISVRDALLEMSDKIKKVWEWLDYYLGTNENNLGSVENETLSIYGILNTCWKIGDTLSGKGTLPLGAIISIHDVGSNVSIPASGNIDSNGFQFCDGVALGSGHGLGTGITNIPNLTDNRFLMGTTLAGTAGTQGGNSGNVVTISSNNLPLHSHSNNIAFKTPNHTHTDNFTTANDTHSHTTYTAHETKSPYSKIMRAETYGGQLASGVNPDTHNHVINGGILSSGGGVACSKSGSVGNNTSIETPLSILPLYMTVKYVMRVK